MQESCKECGKFKVCAESMPYKHIDGTWATTTEKRRWMRKYCRDCFISVELWKRIKGEVED